MSIRTCHHVLANGVLCQAAALRNREYCRFHLEQIGRRMKAARSRARRQPAALKLPLLEDLYSVQVALMQLADAIASREIDPQYARLLTTVLRLAMQNLKSRQAWERSSRFQSAGDTEGATTAWDTFEQEYDLPADLDLSLDPEAAFPEVAEVRELPLSANLGRGEDRSGAPYIPGVGNMGGNDGRPLNPTDGFSGVSATAIRDVGISGNDGPFAVKLSQLLPNAAPANQVVVTADHVEILDVYEREGEQAMMRCIAEQQRNRSRRERRVRRLYYEEVARNRNIQFAAARLVRDQLRDAKAAAGKAQPQSPDSTAEDATHAVAQNQVDLDRKPPQTAAAAEGRTGSTAGA